MSADNGIYILQTKDGFRVIEAQAIENLWYWGWEDGPGSGLNPRYLKKYFGKAERFCTEEEAWKEASRLFKEIMDGDFPILEYGITPIFEPEVEFPK